MATLSVITLTCNRLAHLEKLWEALRTQLGPADEWLLLDTGATDATPDVFANHADPRIRYLRHDSTGGSWAEARNAGMRAARGTLLAFLDDDCLPLADWAARGKAQLLEIDGGCDAVGGMVRPRGIKAFPGWWHPGMGWMVGLSVPAHATALAQSTAYPFTANLFVRAAAARAEPFQELGGALGGAEAERYATGREDAEWWHRLRVRGYATRFDPELAVGHAIDPARLDLKYLRRRAALDGAAWAQREGTTESARREIAQALYLAWRELALLSTALLREESARLGQWHLHRLGRAQQLALAQALAVRFRGWSPRATRWRLLPAHALALSHLAVDSAKAAARELLRPALCARPARPWRQPVERLGVLAFGYLGDLLLLQAVLRGVMAEHPQLEVYVLAPAAAAVALGGIRRLNLTLLPTAQPDASSAEYLATWLHRLDPDALIAPYLHAPWGDVLTRIRRPPCPVAAFDGDHTFARRWQQERLAPQVHKDFTRHEIDNLANLLGWAGLPCTPQPARLTPAEAPLALARAHALHAHAAARGGGVIMLNPDAGQPYKEWDDAHWAELARRLLAETPHSLAINANRPHPELETALLEAPSPAPERIHWLRHISLPDLVGWLATCRALITVDAGPQHIAHALDIPSLTLYGPMDERRWCDYFARPIHRTLRGCTHTLTVPEKHDRPLNQEVLCITPAAVFAQFQALAAAAAETPQPSRDLTFACPPA
jgi:ADP-heptose:LPS heptosyltransferase/GT2 family glycosyltransferase